jgi:hypothetical protein
MLRVVLVVLTAWTGLSLLAALLFAFGAVVGRRRGYADGYADGLAHHAAAQRAPVDPAAGATASGEEHADPPSLVSL